MRIPSLDGLRAISIILVLLAHLSGTRHFVKSGVFEIYGNVGVRIFFVISGYLITLLLLKEHERTATISLRDFYIRRAYRILPAAYVFMLPVILWYARSLNRVTILAAVTYTSNYIHVGNWILGHLWSLSVEEQFYLLLAFDPAALLPLAKDFASGLYRRRPSTPHSFLVALGKPRSRTPFPCLDGRIGDGLPVRRSSTGS